MPDETPPEPPVASPDASERVALERVVELENFRGPLDLLLHLVREQELEITEIDLSGVCDQYLTALDVMRDLDIDVAGEFLVIASTLMLIKSRAILPREEVDLAEEIDPADELIGQLIEYRRFKTLSLELGRRAEERGQRFGRGGRELPPDEERELAEISIWDLVGSFSRLVEELGLERRFDALSGQRPLREYVRDVLAELAGASSRTFRELMLGTAGREGVFGVFLAVLELAKSSQIDLRQAGPGEEIRIALREDRNESALADFLRDDDGTATPDDAPSADPVPEPVPEPAPEPMPDPIAASVADPTAETADPTAESGADPTADPTVKGGAGDDAAVSGS